MGEGIKLEKAHRHTLGNPSNALSTEPSGLDADDGFGKAIRLTLIPDLFFTDEREDLSEILVLAS